MTRAFWERLTFPLLSYRDGSFSAPKKMPVTFIYTMNGMPQANNTTQVNDYSRFEFADGTAEARKRRPGSRALPYDEEKRTVPGPKRDKSTE